MLSGIRTVKRVQGRKRKAQQEVSARLPVDEEVVTANDVTRVSPNRDDMIESTAFGNTSTTTEKSSHRIISKETNVAAAQELRKLLSNDVPTPSKDGGNVCPLVDRHTERLLHKLVATSASNNGTSPSFTFVMDDTSSPNNGRLPAMVTKSATATDISSMTIDQLRREELTQRQSMDEIYARNISRLGSRFQNNDFTSGRNIPETEYDIGENVSTAMFTYSSSSPKKRRGQANPATNDTTNSIYTHTRPKHNFHNQKWSSTWWFQSSSFRKHLLLANGDYVSLTLASAQDSLVDGHCYLVPNQPTESFLSCNSLDRQQFWEEVDRFQSALRTMFWNTCNQRIIICEMMVAGQQARMDVIPCPSSVQHDAPLFFHASFLEQQKLLSVDDDEYHNPTSTSTATKLHKITPQQKITQLPFRKRGSINNEVFPYISVEWAKNEGYAQILTVDTNKRARDNKQRWYLDTLASMSNVEPIHLRNKKLQEPNEKRQNHQLMTEEKHAVWKFLQMWKSYDFTDQNK